MSKKQKFQVEFEVKSSPKILYPYLSTPSGLNEWFADNVTVNGGIYGFEWDKFIEKAKVAGKKDNVFIRFEWLERGDDTKSNFFQFDIVQDELTNDVALMVTDFAEPHEIEESKLLWGKQVQDLRHVVGS